ncbi:uncharacterized protein P884DRAFT_260019 [Thermothelomyces heterothallicus CBS 202.75]|uniref:uncharacterized protein n=1 Tax=Thermothelomyces heterothallicus CBS 202.75 TaxID=1149848 RepID=UPI0037441089
MGNLGNAARHWGGSRVIANRVALCLGFVTAISSIQESGIAQVEVGHKAALADWKVLSIVGLHPCIWCQDSTLSSIPKRSTQKNVKDENKAKKFYLQVCDKNSDTRWELSRGMPIIDNRISWTR